MAVGAWPRERKSKTERIAKLSTSARAKMTRPVGHSWRLRCNWRVDLGLGVGRPGLCHCPAERPTRCLGAGAQALYPGEICGRGFWPSYAAVRVDKRHVRNETIATFWKSLYISRILSRVP